MQRSGSDAFAKRRTASPAFAPNLCEWASRDAAIAVITLLSSAVSCICGRWERSARPGVLGGDRREVFETGISFRSRERRAFDHGGIYRDFVCMLSLMSSPFSSEEKREGISRRLHGLAFFLKAHLEVIHSPKVTQPSSSSTTVEERGTRSEQPNAANSTPRPPGGFPRTPSWP